MMFQKKKIIVIFVIFSIFNNILLEQCLFAQSISKPTIAVFNFKSNTGDDKIDARLSFGTSETVYTDLACVGSLNVVERSRLKAINQEIFYNQTGMVDDRKLVEAGKQYGANYVLTGSWQKFQNQYRLNARIIETETTKIISGVRLDGTDIFDMQTQIVLEILNRINISPNSIEFNQINYQDTRNIDAFDAYSLGLKSINDNEIDKAKEFMEKAIEIDADFDKPKKYLFHIKDKEFEETSYEAAREKYVNKMITKKTIFISLILGAINYLLTMDQVDNDDSINKSEKKKIGETIGIISGFFCLGVLFNYMRYREDLQGLKNADHRYGYENADITYFLNIVKISSNYALIDIGNDIDMKIGEKYDIVDNIHKNRTVGTGKVMKIQNGQAALQVKMINSIDKLNINYKVKYLN